MAISSVPTGSREVPQSRLKCLLLAPTDPLTGGLRAGPLRRLLNPPEEVDYSLATDRLVFPVNAGHYRLSPVNVGTAAVRFAVEHAIPVRQAGMSVAHSFFWDLRKYSVPWVHESDQSFGQFLSSYINLGGLVARAAIERYSSYLNWKRCIGVITWSEWSKHGFVEDGVDAAKVSVIPPPFGTLGDRRPHAGCNVLFLGRDFHRKGGETAIRAFKSLAMDPDCRLTYVGKVDDPSALGLIKEDHRITYLERPSTRTLVEDVWPVTDIFVLPTKADAFALTVVEAMRRGIPVVCTALPAISEVVQDGVSGLLFQVGDDEGFYGRLRRLVEEPGTRKRMGELAKKRVDSLFSPHVVGRALSRVYALAS